MPGPVELIVRKQLREKVPIERIISEWIQRLGKDPKPDDAACFFEFCYNSGRWGTLIENLPLFLDGRWPVHWGIFLEMCHRQKVELSEEILESVVKGARKQNLVAYLVLSHSHDDIRRDIVDFREALVQKMSDEASRKRDTLWEKLRFLQTQRMIEEEEKLLNFMRKAFPEDTEIKKAFDEFEDRWARHVLASRTEKVALTEKATEIPPLDKAQQDWVRVLLEVFNEYIEARPELAYTFAINLYFMELHSEALALLDKAPDAAAKDWLKLDLLLLNRRFVDVIQLSEQVEARYVSDPETSFGCIYSRAKALKGLGQKSAAIDMLKGLLQIRPNYRSAQALLTSWQEDRG